MTAPDTVLVGMAAELREVLLSRGIDTKNPPKLSRPPTEKAFREYQARGGENYDNADDFIDALLDRVGRG